MSNPNKQLLIIGLVRWAQRKNQTDPVKPLTDIVDAVMENGLQDGRFLELVSEAGGAVQFTAFQGFDGPAIIALLEETVEWLNMQPNPQRPRLRRRLIKRLQPDFGGYSRTWDAWFDRLAHRKDRV